MNCLAVHTMCSNAVAKAQLLFSRRNCYHNEKLKALRLVHEGPFCHSFPACLQTLDLRLRTATLRPAAHTTAGAPVFPLKDPNVGVLFFKDIHFYLLQTHSSGPNALPRKAMINATLLLWPTEKNKTCRKSINLQTSTWGPALQTGLRRLTGPKYRPILLPLLPVTLQLPPV